MNYTTTSTPAILRISRHEYKVSPYGITQPDLAARYADSRVEAEQEAAMSVLEAHAELGALKRELRELRIYLLSEKFHADPTVQVGDVLTRMDQLLGRAAQQGREDARALFEGRYPQAG
jgi:hypothetical protein